MTLTTHIQTTAPLTATVQHDQAILDTAIQLVLPNMALTTLTSASQLIRGDTHRIRVAISNTDSTPNLQNASVRATFRRQDNNTQLVQKTIASAGPEFSANTATQLIFDVTLDPADTATVTTPETIIFDVELTLADTTVVTPLVGQTFQLITDQSI